MALEQQPILTAEQISVIGPDGVIVEPINLSVFPEQTIAIVGESGSGKSMTARALTGLLPRSISAVGNANIDGILYNLSSNDESAWRKIRGREIVLLLQDPFTSLTPVMRCGKQIELTIRERQSPNSEKLSKSAIQNEVLSWLEEVKLDADVAKKFPSELSGGMRQRVAIACALAAQPKLLIADEPTTALDASTKGEILDLLKQLQKKHKMGLVLISHDLGVVAGRADLMIVMKNGREVSRGTPSEILNENQDSYTRQLIDSSLSITDRPKFKNLSGEPLLKVEGLSKSFGSKKALQNAGLTVSRGEIVALIGESGSGKSTFARCISGLEVPDEGEIFLESKKLSAGRKNRLPGEIQIVFQDPYSTLNPTFTIEQTLSEAIAAGKSVQWKVEDLLRLVELDPSLASRRPSQLSGGQRQRVAIARAIAPNPKLIICDESVSALDVSVQKQILNLLLRLSRETNIGMLFITHDLGVVANVACNAIVLKDGQIVETGSTENILNNPVSEYTQMLVKAAESEDIERQNIPIRRSKIQDAQFEEKK